MNTKWLRDWLKHPEVAAVERGGKHPQLRLRNDDRVTIAGTPSDWRAGRHIETQIRRKLRQSANWPVETPPAEPAPSPQFKQQRWQTFDWEAFAREQSQTTIARQQASAGVVYHFTTTLALPDLLRSGVLRPDDNDLLWATTSSQGDRLSVAYALRDIWRDNCLSLIRLTCNDWDFRSDWEAGVRDDQQPLWWSPDQIKDYSSRLGRRQPTSCWRWRGSELALSETLLEMRSYRDHGWHPVPKCRVLWTEEAPEYKAIQIGDWVYLARVDDDGIDAVPPIPADDFMESLHFAESTEDLVSPLLTSAAVLPLD